MLSRKLKQTKHFKKFKISLLGTKDLKAHLQPELIYKFLKIKIKIFLNHVKHDKDTKYPTDERREKVVAKPIIL